MKLTSGLAALFIGAALTLAQSPKPAHDKLGPVLQQLTAKDGNVDVIVQFDQDPTDAHHQKVINRGGTLKNTLHSIKAGAYSMPASAVADLARDSSVVHISVDHKVVSKSTIVTLPVGDRKSVV